MDWFSWLSKSSLDASLIYEYGLLLSHNELEEEDIAHFDHEFLQSMGISIAKHRLEILKLAKKHKKTPYISPTTPVSRLLTVIDKTKSRLAKYVFQLFVHREASSAIVVVPRASYGGRWKGIGMKRSNKMVVVKQGRLLLTGRSPSQNDNKPAVLVQNINGGHVDGEDDDGGYWGGDGHDKVRLRWDSMFQDLKPT